MTELYFALRNQGFDKEEAKDIIVEMKEMVNEGNDPAEVLYDYGLEPDYVFDLLYK